MKVTLEPNILDKNVSLNASYNGTALETIGYYGLGMQLNVVVITPLTGFFKIFHSQDGVNYFGSNIFGNVILTALAANNSYGFTGSAGAETEVLMIPWKWTRIVWTRTSGTGSVTSLVTGVRV